MEGGADACREGQGGLVRQTNRTFSRVESYPWKTVLIGFMLPFKEMHALILLVLDREYMGTAMPPRQWSCQPSYIACDV